MRRADVEHHEEILQRLAVSDDSFVESVLADERSNLKASTLDPKTHGLARIAALVTPWAARDQLLQALGVHSHPRRHRFDRLALSRHQQALDVMGGGPPPFASPERGDQGSHKLRELRNAVFPEPGIPFHAPTIYTPEEGGVKNYLT